MFKNREFKAGPLRVKQPTNKLKIRILSSSESDPLYGILVIEILPLV